MKKYLIEGIEKIGIKVSEEKLDNLMKFLKLLMDYNSHTNLTAIRDEKGIIEKHFLDSLLLMKHFQLESGKAIDIGTGAGFPGMVLAICNPGIHFTLIDSVGKKIKFLNQVIEELKLDNVEAVNIRAEEFINPENRETYDLGFCRGVSKLNIILEYIIPFLKVGGRFLPQKMQGTEEEQQSSNALNVLKSSLENSFIEKLPYSLEPRIILEIVKKDKTNLKYPRKTGIPTKKPL
ncbi:16S rRNA (guanine(527)-N(7))-methyltransferase RsmG [Fusobacterium sp. MFO224]|uniref:16S rRNA (guanine(527)-N(7))-methyltransferase RsmG n=1 Tax=Fusobacterium sp. MFO224 TaxID=3378070 RepID=UPI0038538A13